MFLQSLTLVLTNYYFIMKNLYTTLFVAILTFSFAFAQSVEGTWKMNPEAGAFIVGPGQGDGSWFSSDAQAVTDRACYFDDEFVFNGDGSFQNVLGTETWLEDFQGVVPNACGAPVAPHDGSNAGTWAYDDQAGTLTITGTGNYVGLAKVFNGGENPAAGSEPSEITYIVTTLSETQMVLDIQINGDGWWRFTLLKDDATSINELSKDAYTVYPNPASDVVTVKSAQNVEQVRVLDLSGREMMVEASNVVNVSALPTGIYMMEIQINGQVGVEKLVVR